MDDWTRAALEKGGHLADDVATVVVKVDPHFASLKQIYTQPFGLADTLVLEDEALD